jgi:hypothetical protein
VILFSLLLIQPNYLIASDTHKVGQFIFTSPTTATMVLRNSEGVKINYGNGQDFALPTNLTLTKIE